MKKIKAGIIGTGFTVGIAKSHFDAYSKNTDAEITAVYDIIPGRAAAWLDKHNITGIRICTSLDELFSYVDVVSICTPNHTHADLTISALEAGLHVICEKPLSLDIKDGIRILEVLKKYPEMTAMVAFNYRGIPQVRYIKKLIDEGQLGQVYVYRQELGGNRIADPAGVYLEWRMQKSQSGTGALADFGCHMLDLADYLLSDTCGKITKVSAVYETFIKERQLADGSLMAPVSNDDCAVMSAKMESGTLLSLVTSRVGITRQQIEIIAEGGIIYFAGGDKFQIMTKDKNGSYGDSAFKEIIIPDQYLGQEGHTGLVQEFTDAILHRAPIQRSILRGIYIQYLLDMFDMSAAQEKTLDVKKSLEDILK